MNPFDLSASDLLIWGLVLHLIADWPLQNDWMANHKARRQGFYRVATGGWRPLRNGYAAQKGSPVEFDFVLLRHPAAFVHAGIHGALLAFVFGWVALPLALVHLVIDTRWPVVRWSRLLGQTQPGGDGYDVGLEVRFWTDQVFHIATIAAAALLVTA